MSEFSQGQIMLSLSLLSYRGFWDPKVVNQPDMALSIGRGLDELGPLKGDWKLAWGPGTYRYLGSAFDSSMMYVVQHKTLPARYAIVVRGTNPVALFDWLLGDFLAHRQVPWHPGDRDIAPEAKISLSTALGLKILLNMRAENDPEQVPEPGRFDYLLDLGAKTVATIQEAGDSSLADADSLLDSGPTGPAYDKARDLVRRLPKYQKLLSLAELLAGSAAATMGNILSIEEVSRILSLRRRLIGMLDRSMKQVVDAPVAMLMPGIDELSSKQPPGIGLLELLGNLADAHGDTLELFVTGHSKGGALAPALALFLSDTQRNDEIPVRRNYQWNPNHRATIYCYAFAGPTPGNTAFADHFNQQLGRNFYRYTNKLDIVTLAWQSDRMRTVSAVYGDSVTRLPGLELLFAQMADEVENLDYCHPGVDYPLPGTPGKQIEKHVIEFSGPLQANNPSYLLQELHQHLGAYTALLGLHKLIDIKDLLGTRTRGC